MRDHPTPLGFPLKSNKIGIIFLPTSNPSIFPGKISGRGGRSSLGFLAPRSQKSIQKVDLVGFDGPGMAHISTQVLRDLFHKTISYPRIPINQPSIYKRMYITYNFTCLFNAQKLGWNKETPLIQLFFGMSLVKVDRPK